MTALSAPLCFTKRGCYAGVVTPAINNASVTSLHCCRGEARHWCSAIEVLVVTLDDVLIRLCQRQTASGHTSRGHSSSHTHTFSRELQRNYIGTTLQLHRSCIGATSELHSHRSHKLWTLILSHILGIGSLARYPVFFVRFAHRDHVLLYDTVLGEKLPAKNSNY